jgi:hypothetical protein
MGLPSAIPEERRLIQALGGLYLSARVYHRLGLRLPDDLAATLVQAVWRGYALRRAAPVLRDVALRVCAIVEDHRRREEVMLRVRRHRELSTGGAAASPPRDSRTPTPGKHSGQDAPGQCSVAWGWGYHAMGVRTPTKRPRGATACRGRAPIPLASLQRRRRTLAASWSVRRVAFPAPPEALEGLACATARLHVCISVCFVTHLIAFNLETAAAPPPGHAESPSKHASFHAASCGASSNGMLQPRREATGDDSSTAALMTAIAAAGAVSASLATQDETLGSRSDAGEVTGAGGSDGRPLALARLYSILSADRIRRAALIQAAWRGRIARTAMFGVLPPGTAWCAFTLRAALVRRKAGTRLCGFLKQRLNKQLWVHQRRAVGSLLAIVRQHKELVNHLAFFSARVIAPLTPPAGVDHLYMADSSAARPQSWTAAAAQEMHPLSTPRQQSSIRATPASALQSSVRRSRRVNMSLELLAESRATLNFDSPSAARATPPPRLAPRDVAELFANIPEICERAVALLAAASSTLNALPRLDLSAFLATHQALLDALARYVCNYPLAVLSAPVCPVIHQSGPSAPVLCAPPRYQITLVDLSRLWQLRGYARLLALPNGSMRRRPSWACR